MATAAIYQWDTNLITGNRFYSNIYTETSPLHSSLRKEMGKSLNNSNVKVCENLEKNCIVSIWKTNPGI